jgi:hypothetical protein
LQLEYYDVDGNSSFVGNVLKLTEGEISIFSKNPEGYYKVTPDFNTGKQLIFVSKTSNKIIYTITSYIEYGKLFFNFNKYNKKALNFFDEIKKVVNGQIKKFWKKSGTFYIQIWGGISLKDSSGNEIWLSEFDIPPLFKEKAAKNGFSKEGVWKYYPDDDALLFGRTWKDFDNFLYGKQTSKLSPGMSSAEDNEAYSEYFQDKIYIIDAASDFPVDNPDDYVEPEYNMETGEKIETERERYDDGEDEGV